MKFSQIYEIVKDPIVDLDTIKELVDMNAKSNDSFEFYEFLIGLNDEKRYPAYMYKRDEDKFYSFVFNMWKNNILSISDEKINYLYSKKYCEKDFVILRTFLKIVKNVSTKEEVDNIFKNKNYDTILQQAFDKYKWFDSGKYWVVVRSGLVKPFSNSYMDINHRLYLNIDRVDMYKVIDLFIAKCAQNNLPYTFKFSVEDNRSDNIVIYCDNAHLTKYIEILQDIKNNNPKITKSMKSPPLLTGKIDSWIGYGSEPISYHEPGDHSFNEVRAKVLTKTIDTYLKERFCENLYEEIMYSDDYIKVYDYIVDKAHEKICSKLKDKYGRFRFKRIDLDSIHKVVEDNIVDMMCKYRDGDRPKLDITSHGVFLSSSELGSIYKELSTILARQSPNFLYSLLKRIEYTADEYGIDGEKICFDSQIKKMILQEKSKNNR